MKIILNRNQIDSFRLPVKNDCNVANLKLNYNQFNRIRSCEDKTFEIIICGMVNVKLSRCVICAWGYVKIVGLTGVQINYWQSERIEMCEYRDIIIESLRDENNVC